MKKLLPILLLISSFILIILQNGSAQKGLNLENIDHSKQFLRFDVKVEPYFSTEEEYWAAYKAFADHPDTKTCEVDLTRDSERVGRLDVIVYDGGAIILDHERKQYISCSGSR